MLADPLDKIVRHPGVDDSRLARHDVNEEAIFSGQKQVPRCARDDNFKKESILLSPFIGSGLWGDGFDHVMLRLRPAESMTYKHRDGSTQILLLSGAFLNGISELRGANPSR